MNNIDISLESRFKKDLLQATATIDSEIDTINKLKKDLNISLTKALDVMQSAKGRVILTGMGKSGHIGKKIAASLASTGTPSFFVHPAEASHGDLGMITNDDVVIAISNSGESKELGDILRYCKRFGIKIISITKNINSPLSKASDIPLLIPNNGEACPLNLAPTNSSTATLVLGDILVTCMIERKGFTKAEFKQRHPGGKIGALLQNVANIMHKGDEMPLLDVSDKVQQVVIEITKKRLGCVGIVNNGCLVGVITDSDLARSLSPEILNKKASDLMSEEFITISKDVFAVEALRVMNENKITEIFVTENEIPIGIINIHDLLEKGVA